MKARVTIRNVWAFLTGNLRHWLMRSGLGFLIPAHIREQYRFRLFFMRKTCYSNGSCDECGCRTTNLQMASKTCEGHCYPPFMRNGKWYRFIHGRDVAVGGDVWTLRIREEEGCRYTYSIYMNGEYVNGAELSTNSIYDILLYGE